MTFFIACLMIHHYEFDWPLYLVAAAIWVSSLYVNKSLLTASKQFQANTLGVIGMKIDKLREGVLGKLGDTD